jgi:hypothetical protein
MRANLALFCIAMAFVLFLVLANLAAAGDMLQIFEDGSFRFQVAGHTISGALPFTDAWAD